VESTRLKYEDVEDSCSANTAEEKLSCFGFSGPENYSVLKYYMLPPKQYIASLLHGMNFQKQRTRGHFPKRARSVEAIQG
jgi:hypothetical protein